MDQKSKGLVLNQYRCCCHTKMSSTGSSVIFDDSSTCQISDKVEMELPPKSFCSQTVSEHKLSTLNSSANANASEVSLS